MGRSASESVTHQSSYFAVIHSSCLFFTIHQLLPSPFLKHFLPLPLLYYKYPINILNGPVKDGSVAHTLFQRRLNQNWMFPSLVLDANPPQEKRHEVAKRTCLSSHQVSHHQSFSKPNVEPCTSDQNGL